MSHDEDFPAYDGSMPIELWKAKRRLDMKKAITRQSKMLTHADEDGSPLYVMNESGNLRRTKPLSRSTKSAVIERDGSCVWCGSTGPFEVDHITRYVDGGSNEPSNLQTLCEPCHRSKGGR